MGRNLQLILLKYNRLVPEAALGKIKRTGNGGRTGLAVSNSTFVKCPGRWRWGYKM